MTEIDRLNRDMGYSRNGNSKITSAYDSGQTMYRTDQTSGLTESSCNLPISDEDEIGKQIQEFRKKMLILQMQTEEVKQDTVMPGRKESSEYPSVYKGTAAEIAKEAYAINEEFADNEESEDNEEPAKNEEPVEFAEHDEPEADEESADGESAYNEKNAYDDEPEDEEAAYAEESEDEGTGDYEEPEDGEAAYAEESEDEGTGDYEEPEDGEAAYAEEPEDEGTGDYEEPADDEDHADNEEIFPSFQEDYTSRVHAMELSIRELQRRIRNQEDVCQQIRQEKEKADFRIEELQREHEQSRLDFSEQLQKENTRTSENIQSIEEKTRTGRTALEKSLSGIRTLMMVSLGIGAAGLAGILVLVLHFLGFL